MFGTYSGSGIIGCVRPSGALGISFRFRVLKITTRRHTILWSHRLLRVVMFHRGSKIPCRHHNGLDPPHATYRGAAQMASRGAQTESSLSPVGSVDRRVVQFPVHSCGTGRKLSLTTSIACRSAGALRFHTVWYVVGPEQRLVSWRRRSSELAVRNASAAVPPVGSSIAAISESVESRFLAVQPN